MRDVLRALFTEYQKRGEGVVELTYIQFERKDGEAVLHCSHRLLDGGGYVTL